MDSMKQPTATYGCCWLRFVTLWAETSPPKHAYIDPFETPSGGDRLKAHTFGEDSLSACEHVLRPSGEYLGPHGACCSHAFDLRDASRHGDCETSWIVPALAGPRVHGRQFMPTGTYGG